MTQQMTTKSNYFFDNASSKPLYQHKCDIIQSGVWYLPFHDLWVTAGADHILLQWKTEDNGERDIVQLPIRMIKHTKKITCVIDIKNPKLIISCSLDKHIYL